MPIRNAIATVLMVAGYLFGEHVPGCTSLQVVIGDGQDPSTCNFSSLLNAVGAAAVGSSSGGNEGKVIFNCSDPVVISFNDQVNLSGHVIVDGQHQVTLDGNGFFRQLSISGYGSNVTLMNLIVANGGGRPPRTQGRCDPSDLYCSHPNASDLVEKYHGGCLYASNGGILNLNSVTFANCSSVGDPVDDPLQHANDVTFMGGAIYADFYTTVYISNSTFVNNTALHEGGAIYKLLPLFSTFPLALIIRGSVFEGNSALGQYDPTNKIRRTSGGGAIFSVSSMLICDCLFLGNSAEMQGGAIRSYSSDVFIDNSIFVNNTVVSTSNESMPTAKGGAIHARDATTECGHGRATIQIENSLFVSNEAPDSAGALYIRLETINQTLTIRNTSFVASKVTQNSSGTEPSAPVISLSCGTSSQFVFFDGVKLGLSSVAGQRTGLDDSVSVGATCMGGASGAYANISSFVPGFSEMDDEKANDWLWMVTDRDVLGASLENNETCSVTIPFVPCAPHSVKPPVTTQSTPTKKTTTKVRTSPMIITEATTSATTMTETIASEPTASVAKEMSPTSAEPTAAATSMKSTTAMVIDGKASDFACKSVWNSNSADLAFDGDEGTCYVSGLETTSWWMMSFRQAMNLSRITLTGHIDGDVVMRFGNYYDPLGRPCISTAINPVVCKQAFRGLTDHVVIDFNRPMPGVHLSLQANSLRVTRLTICEIAISVNSPPLSSAMLASHYNGR